MRQNLKPSPALIISVIALLIALGGTGYAALRIPDGSVGTRQLKDGAVTARKVRRHTLLVSDFKPGQLSTGGAVQGRRGPTGPTGPRGPQGATGPQGAGGPPGAPGTARAYGLISATGTLDSSRSKNIAGVTHPANGIYCIMLSGINPASTTIVATPDQGESREIAQMDSNAAECGGTATALEVVTRRIEYMSGPPPTVVAFHHDNGFSFVVP